MAYQTDSSSFVNAIELLFQESSAPDRLFRLSKPLSLVFPAFLYKCIGISIPYSFFFQQLLAYWVGAYVLFKILTQFSIQKTTAYWGMLAYIFCQPLAVYGLAILTDGLGWCWMIIGIWISLKTIMPHKILAVQLLSLGIFMGLGLFIKESTIMTGIFTFFLILLHPSIAVKQKCIGYILIGLGFLTSFIIGNSLVYYFWQESIFQWISFGHDSPPPFSWQGFIIQSYHTLDVYWFLFAIGLWTMIKDKTFDLKSKAFLCTLVFSWICLPLVWPYLYDRILFMTAPFMVLWVGIGATPFNKYAGFLILLGGCMNLLSSFAIYKYQITGLLQSCAIFYLLLLIILRGLARFARESAALS